MKFCEQSLQRQGNEPMKTLYGKIDLHLHGLITFFELELHQTSLQNFSFYALKQIKQYECYHKQPGVLLRLYLSKLSQMHKSLFKY